MRLRTLAILLAIALLVPAASALGDGDPASDVLLGANVFYPYTPPVSGSLQKTLNAETAAAKLGGLPIKVALIASPVDLGVIPDLFGQPQKYADFLDQEISFRAKQPLLVVMPAGYGVQGLGPRATSAAETLAKPAGKTSDALAQAAETAVQKLALADGHPIKGVAGLGSSGSGGGSSSTTAIIAVLVVAAIATAGALVVLRRRQSTAS
jgi:hypothetical protein